MPHCRINSSTCTVSQLEPHAHGHTCLATGASNTEIKRGAFTCPDSSPFSYLIERQKVSEPVRWHLTDGWTSSRTTPQRPPGLLLPYEARSSQWYSWSLLYLDNELVNMAIKSLDRLTKAAVSGPAGVKVTRRCPSVRPPLRARQEPNPHHDRAQCYSTDNHRKCFHRITPPQAG